MHARWGGGVIIVLMSSAIQSPPIAPPSARILRLAARYQISRALHMVTQMGIPDLLKDGPKSIEELAFATESHPDALFRVLRALTSLGIFDEVELRTFALTPLSKTLRSDVPGSVRAMVLFLGDDTHWDAYKDMRHSVRSGLPALDRVLGQPHFQHLHENPEDAQLFHEAMAAFSDSVGPAIAKAYDFSKFQTIVDVGGGNGTLLAAILNKHSGPRGIVFDLPHAIEHARVGDVLPAGRSEVVAGDFFESIPAGAGAYVFKYIMHDWQDDKACAILRVCRRAMSSSGKLLLVEMVVPPNGTPDFSKFLDLEMLVVAGGRERTEDEFRQLLGNAGFRLDRVVPTHSQCSIIEGSPV